MTLTCACLRNREMALPCFQYSIEYRTDDQNPYQCTNGRRDGLGVNVINWDKFYRFPLIHIKKIIQTFSDILASKGQRVLFQRKFTSY